MANEDLSTAILHTKHQIDQLKHQIEGSDPNIGVRLRPYNGIITQP
jgi:hypothetical protein